MCYVLVLSDTLHNCNYLTNDSVKAAQHDKTTYSIMQVEYTVNVDTLVRDVKREEKLSPSVYYTKRTAKASPSSYDSPL